METKAKDGVALELEERRAKIRAFMEHFKSQNAFGRAVGLRSSRISKALNDKTITHERLLPIEHAISKWKDKKEPAVGLSKEKPASAVTEAGGMPRRRVAVFSDVSAGPGLVPAEEVEQQVQVSEAKYRRDFGATAYMEPHRYGYCKVKGASAVPFYFDGELVPVKVIGPTQEFTSEEVYIFRWLGDLRLKQLIKLPGGKEDKGKIKVEMRSLDRTQGGQIVKPNGAHDFAVLARVLRGEKQQLYARAMRQIFDGMPAM